MDLHKACGYDFNDAVHKIGKYLFENYDKEFILELTHNNEKLKMIISDVIPNLNTIKKH